MQQTRRNRINVQHVSMVALREAGGACEDFRDAKVTAFGDHIECQVRRFGADDIPRRKEGGVDAVPVEHDGRVSSPSPKRNHLLAALSPADYARLLPRLEAIHLPSGQVICEANSNADYVYFLTTGIVSLTYELQNGTCLEVAHTGNDGVVGVAAFMGGGATTSRAVMRDAGFGYRLRAETLRCEFENSPSLRQLLLRYAQALITQMAQATVCHSRHPVEQQVCRLLLASMDQLPSADVALTHDAMANLLGVRRESITAIAGRLQGSGLIRYHRGRVTVLSRQGLEERVCECYAVVKAESHRLIPQAASMTLVPALGVRGSPPSGAASIARVPAARRHPGVAYESRVELPMMNRTSSM